MGALLCAVNRTGTESTDDGDGGDGDVRRLYCDSHTDQRKVDAVKNISDKDVRSSILSKYSLGGCSTSLSLLLSLSLTFWALTSGDTCKDATTMPSDKLPSCQCSYHCRKHCCHSEQQCMRHQCKPLTNIWIEFLMNLFVCCFLLCERACDVMSGVIRQCPPNGDRWY